jgi:hypothetical protein
MNPYLTSLILELSIIIVFYLHFKTHIKDNVLLLLITALIFPIPIAFYYRNFYLCDIIGCFFLFKKFQHKEITLDLTSKKIYDFSVLLLLTIPLLTTTISFVTASTKMIGDAVLHLVRITFVLIVFKNTIIKYKKHPNKLNVSLKILSLIWIVILVIGLLQKTQIINTDFIFSKNGFYNGSILLGFMGFDKPQLALLAVTFINIVFYIDFKKSNILKLIIIPLSILTILSIGSRQGLLYIMLSFIIYLFNSNSSKRLLYYIPIAILLTVFIISAINNNSNKILQEKFKPIEELIKGKSEIKSLAENRDPLFMDSFSYLINNPKIILFGSGLGNEESGYIQDEFGLLVKDESVTRTYFEGEIFRILWVNGIIGVILYILIMYSFLRIGLITNLKENDVEKKKYAKLLISLSIIFVLYSFGQLNLFTTTSSNISFIYFSWWLFGGILGNIISLKNEKIKYQNKCFDGSD